MEYLGKIAEPTWRVWTAGHIPLTKRECISLVCLKQSIKKKHEVELKEA